MIYVREPAVAYGKTRYTVTEYLEMQKTSDTKYEWYQGEIFAMPGAGPRHNIIAVNLISALSVALNGKPCRPYGSVGRNKWTPNFYSQYRTKKSLIN